jgi:hypothetical protein
VLGVRSSQSRAKRGQDCHRLIFKKSTCRGGQKDDETREMRGLECSKRILLNEHHYSGSGLDSYSVGSLDPHPGRQN